MMAGNSGSGQSGNLKTTNFLKTRPEMKPQAPTSKVNAIMVSPNRTPEPKSPPRCRLVIAQMAPLSPVFQQFVHQTVEAESIYSLEQPRFGHRLGCFYDAKSGISALDFQIQSGVICINQ
jgi:hypothetical protein